MVDFQLTTMQKQVKEFAHQFALHVVRPLSLQADREHRAQAGEHVGGGDPRRELGEHRDRAREAEPRGVGGHVDHLGHLQRARAVGARGAGGEDRARRHQLAGRLLAGSLLAGSLTTLSPCVFPVLPLVVGGAMQARPDSRLVRRAG